MTSRRRTALIPAVALLAVLGVTTPAWPAWTQASDWDPQRFQALVSIGEAETLAWRESGSATSLTGARRAFEGAHDMLDEALRAQVVPPEQRHTASLERFQLAANLVYLEARGLDCDAAEARLDRALVDVATLAGGDPQVGQFLAELTADRRGEVDRCRVTADRSHSEVADESLAPGLFEADSERITADDLSERPHDSTGDPIAAFVLLGLAGASGAAAIALDLWNLGSQNEWETMERACSSGGACEPSEFDALEQRIDRSQVAIWVLAGAAVVTGLTGILLYLLHDGGPEPAAADSARQSVSVGPILSPEGGYGAVLEWQF